jgi:ubiquinone/menaquinone biosynthesis C-methylase UbiE
VDLGCGTGRFTGVLARDFAEVVVGIDPSAPMLAAAAAQSAGAKGVHFARAAAERLPLGDSSADLVFLSMVYHHFGDEHRALASVRRVLRPGGGRFCVRTCTVENLDTYVYQRLIPEARAVDEARLPTRAGLTAAAVRAGMRPTALDTVHQAVARTLDEYVHNASLRAHSDLQAISDEQFARGMADLRAWARTQDQTRPVVEDVDLFTFTVD